METKGNQFKKQNEIYDGIIRHVFGTYPDKCLRKVVADVNAKYNNVLVDYYEIVRTYGKDYRSSAIVKYAVKELIVEAASVMHKYLGYSISELPSVCIVPYIDKLEEDIAKREELIKVKESMYGSNRTINDVLKDNKDKFPDIIDTLESSILLSVILG